MDTDEAPPFYTSPAATVSLLTLLRFAMSDPAAVIPQSIYHDWAYKIPGPGAPLVIVHPDDVREVLLDKDDSYGRHPQMRTLMRRAWGKGLAAAEGEDWVRQHRAAAPVFRPQAVEDYAPIMADVVRRVAPTWDSAAPVMLEASIGRLVAEIVTTTLLKQVGEVDLDQLAHDTPYFVRKVSIFGVADMLPLPDSLLDWLRGIGRSPQEARLRTFANRIADARSRGDGSQQDFPGALRGVGPLADNILGLLPAGYETTVRAATWVIYLLARYPDWQYAARDEAMKNAGGPLMRQIVQETLRLYPPAPILARAATRRIALRGYDLRKGQVIVIAAYAMHRHRQLWDRPDMFDPMRFAPDGQYNRTAFLPFGAGPRMCIAAQFALTEIATIVTELLKLYRFSPSGDAPDVSLSVSTHAKNGIKVRADRI